MLIDWSYFAPALILLLIPSGIFHGKKVRARSLSRDFTGQWSQVLSLPHHAIDFLRAAAGGWLLAHSLTRAPEAVGMMKHAPTLTLAGVLLLGVTLQTVVCREEDALHAPLAYLIGLTAGYLPPLVAGFALVAAIAITMGVHTPAAFFVALPLAVAALGTLFTGKKLLLTLAPFCVAAFLPWLFAVLFSRELVLLHRAERSRTDDTSRLRG